MDGVLPIMVSNEGENNRMIDYTLLAFYSLALLVATLGHKVNNRDVQVMTFRPDNHILLIFFTSC
jgi:hypothetical protein